MMSSPWDDENDEDETEEIGREEILELFVTHERMQIQISLTIPDGIFLRYVLGKALLSPFLNDINRTFVRGIRRQLRHNLKMLDPRFLTIRLVKTRQQFLRSPPRDLFDLLQEHEVKPSIITLSIFDTILLIDALALAEQHTTIGDIARQYAQQMRQHLQTEIEEIDPRFLVLCEVAEEDEGE
jgi:hypothetical protein